MAIDHTVLRMFMTVQDRYALSGSLMVFGVQDIMLSHKSAEQLFKKSNYRFIPIEKDRRTYSKSKIQEVYAGVFGEKTPMHMNDLFKMMNFSEVSSLDAFDAENPTIIQDLNKPIPNTLKEKFDVVFDVGVMEHVFDVRQYVENCVQLLKEQGVLVLFVPLLGWHNECFYNLQPPLFFDVFSANGFDDISAYLNYYPKYHDFGKGKTTWVRFEYGDRVRFSRSGHCTFILFVARKTKTLSQFVVPLQSYYENFHTASKAPIDKEPSHYMLDNLPWIVRKLFPVLVPIYRALPPVVRAPVVDMLMYLKNRSKLASRERIRC